MKIDAGFKADLTAIKAAHDADSNAKTITVTLDTKVSADEAKRILGDEFHKLAFGTMSINDEGEAVWLYKRITPGLVLEKHTAKLLGHGPFPVMPVLTSIEPVKGDRAVVATLQLPLLFESKAFGGELLDKLGDVIDVHMAAAQLELPGTKPTGTVRDNAGPFGNGKVVPIQ